jgi:hypothetical protein
VTARAGRTGRNPVAQPGVAAIGRRALYRTLGPRAGATHHRTHSNVGAGARGGLLSETSGSVTATTIQPKRATITHASQTGDSEVTRD